MAESSPPDMRIVDVEDSFVHVHVDIPLFFIFYLIFFEVGMS